MGKYADGWVMIRDGAQMLTEGAQLIIESMEPAAPTETPKPEPCNLNTIIWTQEQGARGPYEKAAEQDNIDFRKLINILDEHSGQLQMDGYYIWKFSTGNVIGRKIAKR
jgi:hypothetical protein